MHNVIFGILHTNFAIQFVVLRQCPVNVVSTARVLVLALTFLIALQSVILSSVVNGTMRPSTTASILSWTSAAGI